MFGWAVQNPDNPTARWQFRLEQASGGTQLVQWAQLGPARSGLSEAIDRMPDKEQKIVFVRLKEFEAAMTNNLRELKTIAEEGEVTA